MVWSGRGEFEGHKNHKIGWQTLGEISHRMTQIDTNEWFVVLLKVFPVIVVKLIANMSGNTIQISLWAAQTFRVFHKAFDREAFVYRFGANSCLRAALINGINNFL